MLTLLKLALLLIPPRWQVAAVVGVMEPSLTPEAQAVCWRESRCTVTAAHERDAWAAMGMTERAPVRHSWCPWHWSPKSLGVRGPFGLALGFTIVALPQWGQCIPSSWWNFPAVSAWAWTHRQRYRCNVYGVCDRAERRLWDRGIGNVKKERAQQ